MPSLASSTSWCSIRGSTARIGPTTASVPLAEYHALREALEDAADNATLLGLWAGNTGEEAMPAALFDRILDGESPVRVWREFRGLKARELAEAAGVSAACLSDIESGRKPGTARALRRLAKALQVDMNELVASPPA